MSIIDPIIKVMNSSFVFVGGAFTCYGAKQDYSAAKVAQNQMKILNDTDGSEEVQEYVKANRYMNLSRLFAGAIDLTASGLVVASSFTDIPVLNTVIPISSALSFASSTVGLVTAVRQYVQTKNELAQLNVQTGGYDDTLLGAAKGESENLIKARLELSKAKIKSTLATLAKDALILSTHNPYLNVAAKAPGWLKEYAIPTVTAGISCLRAGYMYCKNRQFVTTVEDEVALTPDSVNSACKQAKVDARLAGVLIHEDSDDDTEAQHPRKETITIVA